VAAGVSAAELGPLPISVQRLLSITASPEFDFAEIVDVVAHDMLLTAAVLRSANAAANASAQHIQTVRDAVMRIGAAQTLATAMQGVVAGPFRSDLRRYAISDGELWRHSCAASVAGGLIRNAAAVPLPPSVGTAALLHDLGKTVLDTIPVDIEGVAIAAVGADACALERELFGIDHAGAGALVAEIWKLPHAIVEGIGGHHDLIDDPLPSAICLADFVAHSTLADADAERVGQLVGAAESALLILGIGPDKLTEIVASTKRQLVELLDRFEATPSR
jgi:HD-like signal output (HDOD) protein